jgi:hypothetical protein
LFEQRKRQEEAEKWKTMDQEIAAYAKKRAARELEYKKEQDAKKAEKSRVKDQMIARMEAVNPSYHKTLEDFTHQCNQIQMAQRMNVGVIHLGSCCCGLLVAIK